MLSVHSAYIPKYSPYTGDEIVAGLSNLAAGCIRGLFATYPALSGNTRELKCALRQCATGLYQARYLIVILSVKHLCGAISGAPETPK